MIILEQKKKDIIQQRFKNAPKKKITIMSLLINNSNFTNSGNLKYWNVAAYVVNVIFTFGIGVFGWFGLATNRDISERYVSLVTPDGWAFSIWGLIFLSQAIFVVLQTDILMKLDSIPIISKKSTEENPLVKDGVSFYYIGVCIAQALWSICFSSDFLFLSLLLIAAIAALLVEIVRKQHNIADPKTDEEDETEAATTAAIDEINNMNRWDGPRWLEYLLLQFPFSIHCGWILAASFVNLNVWLVKVNAGASLQKNTAGFSLIGLILISILYLSLYRCELVVPTVLAWASLGIFSALRDPDGQLLAQFDEESIDFFRMSAIVAVVAIIMSVIGKAIVNFLLQKCKAQSDAVNDDYQRQKDDTANNDTADNDNGVVA